MNLKNLAQDLNNIARQFVDCGLESRFLVYNTIVTAEITKQCLLDIEKRSKMDVNDSIKENREEA